MFEVVFAAGMSVLRAGNALSHGDRSGRIYPNLLARVKLYRVDFTQAPRIP